MEKRNHRIMKLAQYGFGQSPPYDLENWPDEFWEQYIADVKRRFDVRTERELQQRLERAKHHDSAQNNGASVGVRIQPTLTVAMTDEQKSKQFRSELKDLRYRYQFRDDRMSFAYAKACQRFEAMEKYFKGLEDV